MPGTCPIIYGDRGLGKSSLALQMVRIAMGDTVLLEHLGFADDSFDLSESFIPFVHPCSDAITNTRKLLQSVVDDLEAGRTGLASPGLELSEEAYTTKIGFKIFETELVRKYTMRAKATRNFDTLDPQDQVLRLCDAISGATGLPVLLVFDELDRVGNTSGLSSFIKSASSESLKFMMVGISQDVSKLIDSHESISRIATPVHVPRMTPDEQEEIIDTACLSLQSQGIDVDFSSEARFRIIELSNGFPWFVHVLGHQALMEVYDASQQAMPSTIDRSIVDQAVENLIQHSLLQDFRDTYQRAVRDSIQREYVLRALAEWHDGDVPTSEVYKVSKRLGVNNPAHYVRQLQQARYGSIIERPPYQQRGLVRFRNAMFKNYIRIRDSLYEGVREEVDGAWTD